MPARRPEAGDPLQQILEPDEDVQQEARTEDAVVALTDRRLAIVEAERLALAVDVHQIRRVEFNIEKGRPGTLIVVPERPSDLPQSLIVQPEHYDEIATILLSLAHRLTDA